VKSITKSELARRLGVSPAAITAYVKKGMPVLRSSRLNLKAALAWHAAYVVPERSGSYSARQSAKASAGTRAPGAKSKPAEEPSTIEGTAPAAPCRVLLDQILSHRNRVPEILAAIGIQDAILLAAQPDIFVALVIGFAGSLDPYDWEREDIPAAQTDIKSTFEQHGLALTPDVISGADKMVEAAFEAIEKAMRGQEEASGAIDYGNSELLEDITK